MHDEPFDFDAPTTHTRRPSLGFMMRGVFAQVALVRGLLFAVPLAVAIWLLLFALAHSLAA